MKNTPIERRLIDETIEDFHIADFAKATIREVKAIAAKAEAASGVEFIKMEMGVPGLPPSAVGVKAEIDALQQGIASLYPDINGLPALKEEASRFIKAFINVDVAPEGCVPVTGSMQGTFASFLTCSQCDEKKDTILFIDPGFPVQKQQLVGMGQKYETFDVYDYRGAKLKEKLESYLKKGNISAIVYSNPNNPSWICLKEEELRIIGELATQYDVIVLEDLAYFAMDFRQDLSKPFQAPYQPSVAHYTDHYVLLISGSKAFSYAGQRIGVSCISDKLYHRTYSGLTKRYGGGTFGTVFIHRVLYALSSGTSHSAQYALAAMLKAANEAQCKDIIDRLPDGLDTLVGTGGTYLSGGENQRIALARAILKDAPIIVLDEATAFADAENEHQIQLAFERLTKNKTVLMIAHRLSTIQDADLILVFKDGQIAERGTHEELVALNGIYSSMWKDYQTSIAWKVGKEGEQHD